MLATLVVILILISLFPDLMDRLGMWAAWGIVGIGAGALAVIVCHARLFRDPDVLAFFGFIAAIIAVSVGIGKWLERVIRAGEWRISSRGR